MVPRRGAPHYPRKRALQNGVVRRIRDIATQRAGHTTRPPSSQQHVRRVDVAAVKVVYHDLQQPRHHDRAGAVWGHGEDARESAETPRSYIPATGDGSEGREGERWLLGFLGEKSPREGVFFLNMSHYEGRSIVFHVSVIVVFICIFLLGFTRPVLW